MTRLFTLLVCLVFYSGLVQAQKSPIKFGQIDKKNLEMTVYPLDSSAGAVVLSDYGYITFDHNFEVSFERHIRIKIFNSSEFDRADVKIRHGRRDMVEKLKASTYNLENGEIVEYELDKKNIFEEKVNKYVDRKVFSLPNVKEGSIIEYTYRVNYGSWSRINPWYFQQEIPVMHSEYLVELPEMFEYRKIMTGYITLDDAEIKRKNMSYQGTPITLTSQRFIAKNVPAFKEEPYMTTREDFISKILFELHALNIPGRTFEQVMPDSYKQLAVKLATSEDVGKRLEKGHFLKDDVERITGGISDPLERGKAIYDFVQENFKVDRDFYEENYKKIYDEKKGYEEDINFILVMMLKEANLQSEIALLSTRENGRVHPFYPSSRNFDFFIGVLTIGEKEYLLDASDKFLPFGTLSMECLNGKGLVISESNPHWVSLLPSERKSKMISAACELKDDGSLNGNLKIGRGGYSAISFCRSIKDDKENYLKNFADNLDWNIDKHDIEGTDKPGQSLSETVHLSSNGFAETLGDIIYLNPMLYGKTDTNPFKEENRLYPIDFGAPVREIYSYSIIIPEDYVVDELPQPLAIALPDNAGKFIYSVQENAGSIVLTGQFMINKVDFLATDYPYLQAFYSQMIAKEAEQVVLKKKI